MNFRFDGWLPIRDLFSVGLVVGLVRYIMCTNVFEGLTLRALLDPHKSSAGNMVYTLIMVRVFIQTFLRQFYPDIASGMLTGCADC